MITANQEREPRDNPPTNKGLFFQPSKGTVPAVNNTHVASSHASATTTAGEAAAAAAAAVLTGKARDNQPSPLLYAQRSIFGWSPTVSMP